MGTVGTDVAILQAAASLMATRGYHGTSVRDVARAVGLQLASLYHHFGSKQEILLLIIRGAMRDLTEAVESAVQAAGADPAAQLAAAIHAHVRVHTERRPDMLVADLELRALEEPGHTEIMALRARHTALFRDPIDAIGVPNAGIVTAAVITMCTDVGIWFRPDGPLDADGVGDAFVAFVLRGAGATLPGA